MSPSDTRHQCPTTAISIDQLWFLDRTNAIHDTSFFAAIVVAVGYQQILSGSIGSIRAPGDVSRFWQPFAAWADSIAARIRERVAINDSQFDEKLLSSIVNDPQKFDSLRHVVVVHSSDPQALQTTLEAISAEKNVLGEAGILAKQASALYMNLKQSSPQQFEYLLYRSKIIPSGWYFWYAKEWRSKATAILVAIALICAASASALELSKPQFKASYFVWRLCKENGTDVDHYRARTKLSQYLLSTPSVYSQLTALLRGPTLSAKTADNILSLLVETEAPGTAQKVPLPESLVESLRTDNSDIRERIQKVLLYLANERGLTVPPDLRTWRSDPKNTASDIDTIVKEWCQVGR